VLEGPIIGVTVPLREILYGTFVPFVNARSSGVDFNAEKSGE
jgi:hypothetical protein